MISKGYVGLFDRGLDRDTVWLCVQSWLERFERVEQIVPQPGYDIAALVVTKREEIMWEENLQFRIINGPDFTWAYATLAKRGIETSGLPHAEISLPLDILLELPGVIEIIEETNDRRLSQLEELGYL